ncbi:MAG: DUF2254 domain-containing protein [Pseudomonadota bacterium]
MLSYLKAPLLLYLRYYRTLGVRVAFYAVLALVVAAVAPLAEYVLDQRLSSGLGTNAIMPVLTILASSMLAVSTFSINVMVAAHRAAADLATPRIHQLLLEDTTTHNVLATFIGAFVYALTSILLIQMRLLPADAVVVAMATTVLVVFLVITAMLGWIQHLSKLGSLENTLSVARARTRESLGRFAAAPDLGGTPMTAETVLPVHLTEVRAPRSGYVQLVDVDALAACLPTHGVAYLACRPGTHVLADEVIARVSGGLDAAQLKQIAQSFVIGSQRTHEQDPAFGLLILSEMASKALSPGVNDPGTAIAAIDSATALLWEYAATTKDASQTEEPRVFVPVLSPGALVEAAFAATARDAAGSVEVALTLKTALQRLAEAPGFAAAARRVSQRATEYAQTRMELKADLAKLSAFDGHDKD